MTAGSTAWAGPPFLTDDPEPVDFGHWEVYLYSAGAYRESDTSGLGPGIEVNYGAVPDVQLHAIVNAAFDKVAGNAVRVGLGDTELGVKYRLFNPAEGDWRPEIGVFPALEVPTGDAREGLGAGHVQAFLPVWLQESFAKWTLDAGGGYWVNPGAGNRNYWFGGILLQRHVTDRFALGVEIFHQTASLEGQPPSSGFNMGGVYDLNAHYHVLLSVGRGGVQYAINGTAARKPLTYYAALQWTF